MGFHLGADVVTIDFNADIPWEELLEVDGIGEGILAGLIDYVTVGEETR